MSGFLLGANGRPLMPSDAEAQMRAQQEKITRLVRAVTDLFVSQDEKVSFEDGASVGINLICNFIGVAQTEQEAKQLGQQLLLNVNQALQACVETVCMTLRVKDNLAAGNQPGAPS